LAPESRRHRIVHVAPPLRESAQRRVLRAHECNAKLP
jgi:hypothetical protein